MYARGGGVAEDGAEAVKWLRKAAEQGHVKAQYSLGVMYDLGDGVVQDFVLAHMWIDLAREQGDMTARQHLKILVEKMTREQIAKAEKMAVEWEPPR